MKLRLTVLSMLALAVVGSACGDGPIEPVDVAPHVLLKGTLIQPASTEDKLSSFVLKGLFRNPNTPSDPGIELSIPLDLSQPYYDSRTGKFEILDVSLFERLRNVRPVEVAYLKAQASGGLETYWLPRSHRWDPETNDLTIEFTIDFRDPTKTAPSAQTYSTLLDVWMNRDKAAIFQQLAE